MKRIDYDNDVAKHFVRHEGWLAAVRDRKKQVKAAMEAGDRSLGLSYFTFCASSAIDVFMLERANLIRRDPKTERLKGVYFCEADVKEYQKISRLIGSSEAGFMEYFEDFVLFEDDKNTKGRIEHDPSKPVPSAEVRRKFNCKRMNQQFLDLHPFDVINLDLYGNLFPPKGEVCIRMLDTIGKVFEMQKRSSPVDGHKVDGFTLFLTVYVHKEDFHDDVIAQLCEAARDNLDSHQTLKDIFVERFPHGNPDKLFQDDFPTFFSIILPKVIAGVAKDHGWFGTHQNIYLYGREHHKKYHMMTSVVHYNKLPNTSTLPGSARDKKFAKLYVPEIESIFRSMPEDVDETIRVGGDTVTKPIAAHLAQTVAFRERRLAASLE